MRRTRIVGMLAAMLVAGRPVAARAASPGAEAGMALLAATANLGYTPAKLLMAGGGLLVGSFTALFTGGDTRAAYAIWVPTASGTYFLRPANLEGSEPIEFFGVDYADMPSTASAAPEAGGIYEAQYSR
jgi:hypothetical protein